MTLVKTEIIHGEDIDENIRNDYQKTLKAVEKAKPTKINKKVDVDIVAKIVERRLLDSKSINKNSGKEKKTSFFNIFFTVLGIMFLIFSVYSFYKNQKEMERKKQEEKAYNEAIMRLNSPDKRDSFIFEDASKYQNINYYGKEDIISDTISHIVNIFEMIKSDDDRKLKMLKSPQKNFLLAGPPGTGKTLFVQKIVGLLDMNLKAIEMNEDFKDKKDELEKMTLKEKFDYLKDIPSKVRAIFLTPSFINDKFVGESEKKVRELFRLASQNTKYDITILFFDEMDAFFVDRSAGGNETHVKSQTEFLAAIGGVQDDIKRKVFCFGATNREDKIDKAFERRFANKITFKMPEFDEVCKLVSAYTGTWENYSEDKVKEVAGLIVKKKMYQSGIVELITSTYVHLAVTNEDKWACLMSRLRSNKKNNNTGVETNLNSYKNNKSTLHVLDDLL
jgi:SpoVK/Ycf46/Vps4 family AAA+-type ATPase